MVIQIIILNHLLGSMYRFDFILKYFSLYYLASFRFIKFKFNLILKFYQANYF